MVSHLTVTPSTASGAPARAFNAQAGGDDAPATDGTFAALLGNMAKADKGARSGMAGMIDAALESLSKFTQAGGADAETQDDQPADPQAIAAVIDAPVAIKGDIDAKATFASLIHDLSSLKQSLDAGEPVDPELLKRIDTALDALGAKFDIDLGSDIGNAADDDALKALLAVTADDATPKAEVTKSLAPLVEALRAASAANASAQATTEVVHPGQLQAVSNKLQALLQALNGKAEKSVDLAALGLADNAAPDAELTAALAKLTSSTAKVEPSATVPTLATPSLKLTEPTLTGKGDAQPTPAATPAETSSDSASAVKPAATPVVAADTGSNSGKGSDTPDKSDKPSDAKPLDAKASAMAAAAADKPVDTQPPAPSQPAQVARVDAVAPRVVQAGYQTSQQQINLPQIAFELVRQVNDGNARFQMRLDPPELGRIDVKLDIGASGHVKAHLVVDKAETLDLMQRDQRALERALQQAGLDSAKTNLEFSLRQSPFSGGQQQGRDQQENAFGFQGQAKDTVEDVPPTINLYRASLSASGVNIIA